MITKNFNDKLKNLISNKKLNSTLFLFNSAENDLSILNTNKEQQVVNINIGTIANEKENKLSMIRNNLFLEIIGSITKYKKDNFFNKKIKEVKKITSQVEGYGKKSVSLKFWIKNLFYVVLFIVLFTLWKLFPMFFQNIFTFISKSFVSISLVFFTFVLANLKIISSFFGNSFNNLSNKFIDSKYYAKLLINKKRKSLAEKPLFLIFNNIDFINDKTCVIETLKIIVDSLQFMNLIVIINSKTKNVEIKNFIEKYFQEI